MTIRMQKLVVALGLILFCIAFAASCAVTHSELTSEEVVEDTAIQWVTVESAAMEYSAQYDVLVVVDENGEQWVFENPAYVPQDNDTVVITYEVDTWELVSCVDYTAQEAIYI